MLSRLAFPFPFDGELGREADASCHFYQLVDAEFADIAVHEFAYSGTRHAKAFSCLRLCDFLAFDICLDHIHQLGAHLEAGCFFRAVRDVRDVHSPVGVAFVADSNLPDTTPNTWHGLPILRIESLLDAINLAPHVLAGSFRKCAQIAEGRTQELYVFHRIDCLKFETKYQA